MDVLVNLKSKLYNNVQCHPNVIVTHRHSFHGGDIWKDLQDSHRNVISQSGRAFSFELVSFSKLSHMNMYSFVIRKI